MVRQLTTSTAVPNTDNENVALWAIAHDIVMTAKATDDNGLRRKEDLTKAVIEVYQALKDASNNQRRNLFDSEGV